MLKHGRLMKTLWIPCLSADICQSSLQWALRGCLSDAERTHKSQDWERRCSKDLQRSLELAKISMDPSPSIVQTAEMLRCCEIYEKCRQSPQPPQVAGLLQLLGAKGWPKQKNQGGTELNPISSSPIDYGDQEFYPLKPRYCIEGHCLGKKLCSSASV